jgi:hypothetical protein
MRAGLMPISCRHQHPNRLPTKEKIFVLANNAM